MTFEIGLVLGVLVVAIILFITEKLRVDVVAVMVLVTLALTGLLEPKQALTGFSNPAVITVWAVFILSGGLARTGVAGILGNQVLRLAGSGEARLIVLIMLTSAFLSAFMNNVGVAALLLPVVMDISKRTGRPPSKLLIPLAFSSLLGGLTTQIGTPPNILITEALKARGLETFSLFDFAPVGGAVVVGGILYMALIGRRLLPDRNPAGETAGDGAHDLGQLYSLGENVSFIQLPPDSALDGVRLAESRLGAALGLNVIGIFRGSRSILAPGAESELRAGDRLMVEGPLEQLAELRGKQYLHFEDEDLAVERLVSTEIQVAELHCSGSCPLIGHTLRELEFRRKFGAIVLAIQHEGVSRRTGLENVAIQDGDVVLVQGTSEQLEALAEVPHVRVEMPDPEEYDLERRLMAVKVPERSVLAGKTLAESRLGDAFRLGVMGIVRDGRTRLMPATDETIAAGDTLLIKGRKEDLARVEQLQELEIDTGAAPDLDEIESNRVGLAEAVLSPHTNIAGKNLRDLHFREKYGLNVVGISRAGTTLRTGLRDLPLQLGDGLLLHGPRQRLKLLGTEPDFIVLTQEAQEPLNEKKAPLAALLMAGVVLSVLLGLAPIYIAGVTGAILMVLTGCLTMDDAYRAIEWRAVFLIAGMLPLGLALEQTGAARWLTDQMLGAISGGAPILVMAGLYVATAMAAQVMPTSAVAILMSPIALNAAADLGLSPHALMMTVALAASASFMSPVAHPANVLIMGPGGYKFSDYTKIGLPLTLICLLIVLFVLPVFWPLTP